MILLDLSLPPPTILDYRLVLYSLRVRELFPYSVASAG
jgi:hypothetical protein